MKLHIVSEEDYEDFVKGMNDSLFESLEKYEEWKRALSILRAFWARRERRVALLGVEEEGEIIGVARLLVVPFYERRKWGKSGELRGELQDIYVSPAHAEQVVRQLVEGAEEILSARGVSTLAVSTWFSHVWSGLDRVGMSPYARSVLFYWDTASEISLEGNPDVEIRLAGREDLSALRNIQRQSWGFFIPPNFSKQDVLLAFYRGEAVGSAYLNKYSGNIDFGVHVAKPYQRMRIGTAILRAALNYYREKGFKRMFVVRVLRSLSKVNIHDSVALKFYRACGGRIAREYRGYRWKKVKRRLKLVDLDEYFS